MRRPLRRAAILLDWVATGCSPTDLAWSILRRGENFRYFYARYRRTLGAAPTILDIGAADGRSRRAARRLWPKARIVSFEPNPRYFQRLREAAASDPLSQAYPYALGARNGPAVLHILGGHMEASSLKQPADLGRNWSIDINDTHAQNVEQKRLDDLDLGIGHIDILKIDVQGAEADVLAGGPATLKSVSHAVIECGFAGDYEDAAEVSDIVGKMAAAGLHLSDIINLVRHNDGRLLQCDLIFLRPGRR